MKNLKNILCGTAVSMLCVSSVSALEFGHMGNTPASVGGAGVAYKKNKWALYYNPALISASKDYSVAYSLSLGYGETNLMELVDIDYDNLQNIANVIYPTTTTRAATRGITRAPRAAGDYDNLGILTDMLKNMGDKDKGGIKDADSLKEYLNKVSNGNGGTLQQAIQNITSSNDKDKIFETIKGDMQQAAEATGNGVLSSVIENIDQNKVGDFLNGFSNGGGKPNFQDILDAVGGLSVSRGKDSRIDKFLDDYKLINNALNKNNFKFQSYNGLEFHFSGGKSFGAMGIGLLNSIYGNFSVEMDNAHKSWIIKSGTDYYKVEVSNSAISLNTAKQGEYDGSSILSANAKHSLDTNLLVLAELPIAYSHYVSFPVGEFHFGGSVKYIYAASAFDRQSFSLENVDFNLDNMKKMKSTSTLGVDIGALYSFSGFSVGIVGKNLNSPKIKTANGKFSLDRQIRAGMGLELWKLTFLLDVDLVPNNTLSRNIKSQMIGGGVIFDAGLVDFRLGAMGDMQKNPYKTIITGGINLFNFLDIAVQSSLVLKKMDNIKLPNYLNISIGGRYAF